MSIRHSRAACALILILAALLACGPALAESIEVKLNASTRVYQSASTSARYVKAPKSLRVMLKAYAKGWGKVSYKGRTGYVKLKYLDRVDPLKAYVTENATVYKDAEGKEKLSALASGATVYVLGVDGAYVRVQNKDGSGKGYVKAGALSTSKPGAATAAAVDAGTGKTAADTVPESLRASAEGAEKSNIERTIFVAQNLIGAPYAAKANPPKSFDCARYAAYCYGAAESSVLRGSSKTQGYDDRYQKLGYEELKRGDMVCFDTVSDDDLSDHVGIYLGGGYFLHASSAAKKVILSSLSVGYYKRTFSWGRRIFEE